MAKTMEFTPDQLALAKSLRDNHQNEREYRASLVFLGMAEAQLTSREVASLFGITERTVFNDLDVIRNHKSGDPVIWGGGNNHLLTFEEEIEFIGEFYDEALEGLIITMKELHVKYNERVGKETPKSTFYRLLHRHGWRKVKPDTRHPKSNPEIQEEFKKKHSKWKWIKLF